MNKGKMKLNKFFFLLYVLIASSLILGIGKVENKNSGKINKNIYIQSLDVGKMTINQAEKYIYDNYKVKTIQIKHENKIWVLKPENIDLKYNYQEVVRKAYMYTRTENIKENLKRKLNLRLNDPYYIKLRADYDEIKLSEFINIIAKDINIKEKEASFEVKDNLQIITSKSKEGREVDIIKLKEKIYNMILDKKLNDISLQVKKIKPNISTEDVESINTVLGQYSTSFNNNSTRGNNIYVAGKITSDILIMPGEVFSYNKATGARNWVNGYKTAKVIIGGKFVDGEGGGVCQVSTTIYNAVLLSGLDILEVHNHTYPSRYAPKGRDAAVSYGYTDFKFINSFSHPIYIKNIVNNGSITCQIYGCSDDQEKLYIKIEEKYEKDKINVKTFRIYFDEENNKIREELVNVNKYKIK